MQAGKGAAFSKRLPLCHLLACCGAGGGVANQEVSCLQGRQRRRGPGLRGSRMHASHSNILQPPTLVPHRGRMPGRRMAELATLPGSAPPCRRRTAASRRAARIHGTWRRSTRGKTRRTRLGWGRARTPGQCPILPEDPPSSLAGARGCRSGAACTWRASTAPRRASNYARLRAASLAALACHELHLLPLRHGSAASDPNMGGSACLVRTVRSQGGRRQPECPKPP